MNGFARAATVALALAGLAALAGCNRGDGKDQAAQAMPALPVGILQTALREVPVVYEAVGRTEGSRDVQVRARVAGILEQQLYTEGDTVKEGAPLFRIERAPFEIDLAQQRGALAQELARNDLAKRDVDRAKDLVAKGFVSQQYADNATATLAQSDAALQVARARVQQAELNLSYTEVTAPIGGITGRALQSIGSLLAPNADSSLLTTITRTNPIWVRFALSEAEFAGLRNREAKFRPQVRIETADGKAYPAKGYINFAGSTVDASLGTVQMRAEFPNPNLQLLPGQYVRVQVIAGNLQAIVVPQAAVLQNESGRFVWVVGPDGKATPRPIRTGNWVFAVFVTLCPL